jgi:uncharacterized protein YbjT (DUF2867 family)
VTGTVGREVYRALRERGVEVRIGARPSSEVAPEARDVVPLDFAGEPPDPAIFDGVDALFFMTPLIEDQVSASRRFLEVAMDGGVAHVVRLSSRSAGWDERSRLRAWHREIEGLVKAAPASWTILRPCSFFQNFIRYQAEAVRKMSSIILPQGDGLIAYVDAADLGDVASECLVHSQAHRGRTYVLTGGRAYGVKGVAAEIGRVIGKPVTYINVDPEQAEANMRQGGVPPWLVEAALAVFAHARKGGEAEVDPTLAKILGRPATTLSEFVERNREAWL